MHVSMLEVNIENFVWDLQDGNKAVVIFGMKASIGQLPSHLIHVIVPLAGWDNSLGPELF